MFRVASQAPTHDDARRSSINIAPRNKLFAIDQTQHQPQPCPATKASARQDVIASSTSANGNAVEHNISEKDDKSQPPPRRPDLSTFFSQLELVDTSDPQTHTNTNAVPQPENMSAAFRLLANAFEMMRGRPAEEEGSGDNDLLANMIEVLRQNADDPPTELKGVPDSFLDELERVPKAALKPSDTCPICVNPFLEGK